MLPVLQTSNSYVDEKMDFCIARFYHAFSYDRLCGEDRILYKGVR